MTELEMANHLTVLLEQQMSGVDNSSELEIFKGQFESEFPLIYSLAYEKAKVKIMEDGAGKIEKTDAIPDYLKIIFEAYKDSNFTIMRIYGESMLDAGISDGDYCIIDNRAKPKQYDIVVVEYLGKIFIKKYSENESEIVLLSANKNYPDIKVNDTESLKIAGVVVSIIKIS
jgi:SOS-response transcriptional repressor LexA